MKSYGFADLLTLTRANRAQLTHWTQQKIVHADVAKAKGTGHHRRFSFLNVLEAAVAYECGRFTKDASLPNPVTGAVTQYIRDLEGLSNFYGRLVEGFRTSSDPVVLHNINAYAELLERARRFWPDVRTPGPNRAGVEFFGVTYQHLIDDPEPSASPTRRRQVKKLSDYGAPIFHVLRAGQGMSAAAFWAPSAVVVNVMAILVRLEKASGDQLPPFKPSMHADRGLRP